MCLLRRFTATLPTLASLMVAACATAPQPLQSCTQEETNQFGKQNVVAIAKGGSMYPEASAKAKETGVVKVAVDFVTAGAPPQISLFESSGHAALDEAAMKRLRETILIPPVCGGRSSPVRVIMPMRFDIDSETAP